ncbi:MULTISPECIES: SAM-dependent methyltransferase [Halobacteriovorax]|uniref:Ribosomal RNA large subunit methyltransferase E n=1 Tax=Halobacteriovorax vibrionivorans TaxID=2152716 RepID=A0ABY0IPR9_9BACT|nr:MULTISPECIES: RlmE family RNA methyltransferase [Halobacteriovorax]RZF23167.1 RlmE family RNA methyltransferase [Halobacteriovorax vibrionivorans]TGD45925.1 RlmE family RNA methyltransferase [Halobacteriovorax sp. Y22]
MTFKVKDYYYKKAKKENFLARSIYKLEEIDNKYKVIKKGNNVLDLGYFPGSWMQYTSKKIGPDGFAVGIDIKPVNKKLLGVKNIKLFEKSIFDVTTVEELDFDDRFDVVISDMAPNTTGVRSVDQLRSLNLIEQVFHHLPVFLKPGGNFVIKVFDGHEAQVFLKSQKNIFKEFHFLKPKSTRSVSKEFFVIGKGYKGDQKV